MMQGARNDGPGSNRFGRHWTMAATSFSLNPDEADDHGACRVCGRPSEHNEKAGHVGENLPCARQIAEVAHETSAPLAGPLGERESHYIIHIL